jgi:hypothetical protein
MSIVNTDATANGTVSSVRLAQIIATRCRQFIWLKWRFGRSRWRGGRNRVFGGRQFALDEAGARLQVIICVCA